MQTEYAAWHSPAVGQKMELKAYGWRGRPVLVFPTSGGRFHEYEDFGMIGALQPFLEEGRLCLFAVDSLDRQTWLNGTASPAEKAARHESYERYILEEVLPFIHGRLQGGQKVLSTGCSLGAYHAANIFFRHPDRFDAVIGLSGLYSLGFSLGDDLRDGTYFHSPLHYLPALEDPWFLERYRESRIVLCAGQGAWEEESIRDTLALKGVLESKAVPAWVDLWGFDVDHDWPWWHRQMPYFLGSLGY
jgi:Uncharacterized protein conserved in bacteria